MRIEEEIRRKKEGVLMRRNENVFGSPAFKILGFCKDLDKPIKVQTLMREMEWKHSYSSIMQYLGMLKKAKLLSSQAPRDCVNQLEITSLGRRLLKVIEESGVMK